jgi:hypothetical protein
MVRSWHGEVVGFVLVHTHEFNGEVDQFYYNFSGYQDPMQSESGTLARDGKLIHKQELDPESQSIRTNSMQYWSSSESEGHSHESDPDLRSFYVLDIYGRIHDHYRSVKALVRCVSNI